MNASNKDKAKHEITTKAISRIISSPSTKSNIENATIVVITDEETEGKTYIVPSSAAL